MLNGRLRQFTWRVFLVVFCASLSACAGSSGNPYNIDKGVFGPNVHGTPDTFRGAGVIGEDQSEFCFGGPQSRCRAGDVLLQTDKARFVIQKPDLIAAGVNTFGGNIIDADLFRPSSEPGQDQFSTTFPNINISWVPECLRLEILSAEFPIKVRATCVLSPYHYIQAAIIKPFAKSAEGVDLFFDPRFDDVFNPFQNMPELREINHIVVTDYTIPNAESFHVAMDLQMQNQGEEPVAMPVGDWINGSGDLELFASQHGFINTALVEPVTGFVYQGLGEQVGVSYGLFPDPKSFLDEEGEIQPSASMTIAGVSVGIWGEGFLQLIPLNEGTPKIATELQPGVNRFRRYFVVGDGSGSSVLDHAMEAMDVSRVRLSGMVQDSSGAPIERARVVVLDEGSPVSSLLSDANGEFAALIPSGQDELSQSFGSGSYTVEVYREGYIEGSGPQAGTCSGGHYDTAGQIFAGVVCTLGESATLSLSASSEGQAIPTRVTIVGFDPSPIHEYAAPEDFGRFGEINLNRRPYGVVDVLYLDPFGEAHPKDNPRVMAGSQIRLEPGDYEIFMSRGHEYSVYRERISLPPGGQLLVQGELSKISETASWVSFDGHMHAAPSADTGFSLSNRVRGAAAEGLDVMVGTDHDYIVDYAPVISKLGFSDYITAISGQEITLLNIGHILGWPLEADTSEPDHGAYNYVDTPEVRELGPQSKRLQSPGEVFEGLDATYPWEVVKTAAHVWDDSTGWFSISKIMPVPSFEGVGIFDSFSDPVRLRMGANTNSSGGFQGPFPLGTSPLFSTNFSAIELIVGPYDQMAEHLVQTALPVWFAMLNVGLTPTSLGNSDSHAQISEPLAIPRNYAYFDRTIESPQDVNPQELAQVVNQGQVYTSNCPLFENIRLTSPSSPDGISLGGTLSGEGAYTLDLEIVSNAHCDWDTVEIYANTEPTPANDTLTGVTELGAESFLTVAGDYLPVFLMAPHFSFHRDAGGEGGFTQEVSGNRRRAVISTELNFSEDTWVVVVVRGINTPSVFPLATRDTNAELPMEEFLDALTNDPRQVGGVGSFAWSNPMFIDIAGDGFDPLYVRQGLSPLLE